MSSQVFRSAFNSPDDLSNGKRPVIFDVLGPDMETSLLPSDLRLVMHYNPTSMSISYTKHIERIQTDGGYVEQHWNDSPTEISLEATTGAFMRMYTGLSTTTNPAYGGTRRETIAYDKYLDMLALFHHNGSVYDSSSRIVLQGIIKMTFDQGVYLGWFSNFSVSESAEKPNSLSFTFTLSVHKELWSMRTTYMSTDQASTTIVEPETARVPTDLDGRS